MTLTSIIHYTVANNSFRIEGEISESGLVDAIDTHLRNSMGAGADHREPERREVYQIAVEIDVSTGDIRVGSDCNNNGLREGILLEFMRQNLGANAMRFVEVKVERVEQVKGRGTVFVTNDDAATKLVVESIVRAALGVDDRSIIGCIAKRRLMEIANSENEDVVTLVLKERQQFLDGFNAIMRDVQP